MTKFPSSDEDQPLVDFLRQHRPTPPPSSIDLEEQIFLQTKLTSPRSRAWLLPSALVAALLTLWGGYCAWNLAQAPVETAKLETFVANNWNSTVEKDTELDWFRSAD